MAYRLNARSIRYSSSFQEQADMLRLEIRRLDDQLLGIEWAIATCPELCLEIQGTKLRIIKTDPFPAALPLRVYFTIDDDNYCTVCWIERIEEPSAEED